MERSARTLAITAVALVVGLLATACGGGSQSGTGTDAPADDGVVAVAGTGWVGLPAVAAHGPSG